MIPTRYENADYGQIPQEIRDRFEKMRETRRGLYIHGTVGTGKTYAVYAMHKHAKEKMNLNCRIFNTTELLEDIRKDFDRQPYDRKHWDTKLIDYRGLLILDDIGAEKMSEWVQQTFYLIINARYNEMLPIVFTSNLCVGELAERVGDRIASRIVEMCDVVELIGKDRRMVSPQKVQVRV